MLGRSNCALAKIDAETQALAGIVLPKSPVGEAVRYLTNQWAALQRFAEDGRLAIDNNRAENQLRLVTVGRKNWLFAGSLEGARRAVLLYSLVQSYKLIDVPPVAYLKDVLLRLATHPHRLIDQLTPAAGQRPSARPPADRRLAIQAGPASPSDGVRRTLTVQLQESSHVLGSACLSVANISLSDSAKTSVSPPS